MLITKEQQEAWVSNYVKEKHTQDECIGFIDGVEKALDIVNKNIDVKNSNWFERLPLHWKLTYYLVGGIIIGLLLPYCF